MDQQTADSYFLCTSTVPLIIILNVEDRRVIKYAYLTWLIKVNLKIFDRDPIKFHWKCVKRLKKTKKRKEINVHLKIRTESILIFFLFFPTNFRTPLSLLFFLQSFLPSFSSSLLFPFFHLGESKTFRLRPAN